MFLHADTGCGAAVVLIVRMKCFSRISTGDEGYGKEWFRVRLKLRMPSPVRAADNRKRQPIGLFHLNRRHGMISPPVPAEPRALSRNYSNRLLAKLGSSDSRHRRCGVAPS